jgi:hypothetical protein
MADEVASLYHTDTHNLPTNNRYETVHLTLRPHLGIGVTVSTENNSQRVAILSTLGNWYFYQLRSTTIV